MSPWKLAILNLIRRRLTSFIAIISIAVSVAATGVLLRLYILSGSRFSTIARGGDAIVAAKAGGISILLGCLNLEGEYPGFLPMNLYRSLKAQETVKFEDGATSHADNVKAVIPLVYFAQFSGQRAIGTDSSFFKRPKPEENPIFAEGSFTGNPQEIVVGNAVAMNGSLKIGSVIDLTGWGPAGLSQTVHRSAKVTGILGRAENAWDHAIFADVSTAQSLLSEMNLASSSIWHSDVLNYFLVYVSPSGRKDLESLVNQRTVGEIAWIEKEYTHLQELTGSGRVLGLLISVMVMAVGGLAVAGIMISRFEAMNLQMALVRAMGFTKSEIAKWLLTEGLLLGFAATLLGAALDASIFAILQRPLQATLPNADWLQVPLYNSWPVWLVAILATVLAVFLPLIRLYRQNVHDSLKGL